PEFGSVEAHNLSTRSCCPEVGQGIRSVDRRRGGVETARRSISRKSAMQVPTSKKKKPDATTPQFARRAIPSAKGPGDGRAEVEQACVKVLTHTRNSREVDRALRARCY